jgi:dephospho-CoA kinase
VTRPIAVAVTGGIGAGKTEALAAFGRHGAAVVSSDEIVHHLLRSDEKVKRAVVDKLGHGVVAPDGSIDRGAVAQVVFRDPKLLGWLEGLLHPLVSQEYLRWREQLAELPTPPRVCVTEVPLLFEAGGETRFDKVVVVTAPRKLREARTHKVLQPDREQRLLPDREKVARADYSYVNTGSIEELDRFVAKVMADLSDAPPP